MHLQAFSEWAYTSPPDESRSERKTQEAFVSLAKYLNDLEQRIAKSERSKLP